MQQTQTRKKSQNKVVEKSILPIQDHLETVRETRSKKYLATVRALRMNYDILAEYEAMLGEPPQVTEAVELQQFYEDVRIIEIKKEIELITADIKQLEETLTELMPKGDALIARLYKSANEATLMARGIISCNGRPYDTVEELCEGAYTEQERRALILGNVKLHSQPTPLVIEVFEHLVNRVNADGTVDVFEL